MALLSVNELSVVIDQTSILDAVTMELSAGEILGLAGESGSGKTMLAMAIAGLLPERAKMSGDIVLDGVRLSEASESELCAVRGQDIGIVFQEPMTALNPVMTIGRQVAETIRIHRDVNLREARSLASEALDKVGLPVSQFARDRYPHSLSGGQRQRVAIAIAIALKPKLLIADEATTALDVTTQADIIRLFRHLVDNDGIGLVLVTHDIAVIAQCAGSVAILKSGEMQDQGEVADVLQNSQRPYVRMLIKNAMNSKNAAYHRSRHRKKEQCDAPVLDVRNIVREYFGSRTITGKRHNLRAVDDVSLQIFAREHVGLVGESGCGKTTLLRTILALDEAQAGDIRLLGRRFPANPRREMRQLRRHIQVVFQDPYGSFDPRWRTADVISEAIHLMESPPRGLAARKVVDRVLDQVGLKSSDADKYPHEFSGGQRQRIAIARALVTEPSIIALDEAVSALDMFTRTKILDLLAELSDRLDMSYLFVTHDLSVVQAVTDRVLVMKTGKIVEQGDTDEIFANPQHPYTVKLLGAVPSLDRALSNL